VPSSGDAPGGATKARRGRQTVSRRATLASIAAKAGVSTPTVSKVVNGRPDVAPSTRLLVERLLDEHYYLRPGDPGRRRSRPRLIDVVFRQLDSLWVVDILRGVEEWAGSHETAVAVSAVRTGDTRPASWTSALARHKSYGVNVAIAEVTERQLEQLRAESIPLVVVDPVNQPPPELPSVGTTNWAGGLAATEHLLQLGHRRIAAISGPEHFLCSRARLDGYRSALERARVRFDRALVRHGDFLHEGGFRYGGELLDLADRPTAIFAGNDQQALGVYEAARKRGLRIPEDLSVVGFDDLALSRWLPPPLTTVRQALTEMGRVAAQMLGQLIAGGPLACTRVELSTDLIVRESTGPAPVAR
jgi:LacI family transcriptional regulator